MGTQSVSFKKVAHNKRMQLTALIFNGRSLSCETGKHCH